MENIKYKVLLAWLDDVIPVTLAFFSLPHKEESDLNIFNVYFFSSCPINPL